MEEELETVNPFLGRNFPMNRHDFKNNLWQKIKAHGKLAGCILILLTLAQTVQANEFLDYLLVKRRAAQTNPEISYIVYPLAYSIPGVGTGYGIGGTVTSLLGDNSTASIASLRGEWEVDTAILTGIPLFTQHLTLSALYANAKNGGFAFYGRGTDSPSTPEFTLFFERVTTYGVEFGLNFFDRQLEFYGGVLAADLELDDEKSLGEQIAKIAQSNDPDEQREEIANVYRNFFLYIDLQSLLFYRGGFLVDLTDDRIDPRTGYRFQYERLIAGVKDFKGFHIDDYSLTGYFPTSKKLKSVIVGNFFLSTSTVTQPSGTNTLLKLFAGDEDGNYSQEICEREFSGIQAEIGASAQTFCEGISQAIDDYIETESRVANSTSLGGPQRLRSYPISRFHDSYSFFTGVEYRYYFLEEVKDFDFIIQKGVFEGLQLAAFYELGNVSRKLDGTLFENLKYSVGGGVRLLLSSLVLRADYATGAEGGEFTAIIGYGF